VQSRQTYQFQVDAWVPFPIPRVFAFFSDLENLARIMPPEADARLDQLHLLPPAPPTDAVVPTRAAGIGSLIVTSFRIFPFLPLRAQWIARVTEFEWNHHFADVQQKGPFKRWHHRHEFLPENRNGIDGTVVSDAIEYEVGYGPLGALAHSLFIGRQMRATFAHRQRVLPEFLF
jgi:ligand-binding SRPBCC domain-containing protein